MRFFRQVLPWVLVALVFLPAFTPLIAAQASSPSPKNLVPTDRQAPSQSNLSLSLAQAVSPSPINLVPTDRQAPSPSRTLVLGMAGVSAQDVPLSTLDAMAALGDVAVANVQTRTTDVLTCPYDGWMSLRVTGSAIDQSGRTQFDQPCRPALHVTPETTSSDSSSVPVPAVVEEFEDVAAHTTWPKEPLKAIGIGEGPALALADSSGRVEHWLESSQNPAQLKSTILTALQSSSADVYVDLGRASDGLGALNDRLLAAMQAFEAYESFGSQEVQEVHGTSEANGSEEAREALANHHDGRSESIRIVVASLGQSDNQPRLQFAAIIDTQTPSADAPVFGLLKSDITRSAGLTNMAELRALIQRNSDSPQASGASATTNDAPTANSGEDASAADDDITSATGSDTAAVTGSDDDSATNTDDASATGGDSAPVTNTDSASATGGTDASNNTVQALNIQPLQPRDALAHLKDDVRHSDAAYRGLTPFFIAWGVFLLIGLLAALLHFVRKPGEKDAPTFIWGNISVWNSVAFAVIPAAMVLNFVPWWRISTMPAWPIALTFLIAIALTGLARSTPHPVPVLAALLLLVVSIDIVSGANLMRDSFFGSMTLTSRRFYGVSNRSYIMLLVAGLLAVLPAVAKKFQQRSRKLAALQVAGMGVAVLALDALPMWGADFGGPPGIVAGFLVAFLLVKGQKPRWKHLLVWLVFTVAAMGVAGLVDRSSRTPSHIGRFWSSVGSADASELVRQKISDLTYTFIGSPLIVAALVGGVAIVMTIWWAGRKLLTQSSAHRQVLTQCSATPGLVAAAAGIAVGVLVAVPINDSAALMVVDGIAIGLPPLVAIATGRLQAERTRYRRPPASDDLLPTPVSSTARDGDASVE